MLPPDVRYIKDEPAEDQPKNYEPMEEEMAEEEQLLAAIELS